MASKPTSESSSAIHTSIERLAALFEFGALQADTDPAAFLGRVADELVSLREERARLKTGLVKINEIRSSIVGMQKINWSEHIYPLVAALDEAGMVGMTYEDARPHFGTMLERTLAAELRARVAEAELTEAKKLAVVPVSYDNALDFLTVDYEGRLAEGVNTQHAVLALSAIACLRAALRPQTVLSEAHATMSEPKSTEPRK